MIGKINGIRLAYEEYGRGNPLALLLIHGFPLDGRMWRGQIAALSEVAHVIVPDLRGHGRSEVPPGPYTMEQHADDMAALLDHVGVERAVIGGLSMGGYVVFAFWRRYRTRVRGLTLLDTRAEPDSEDARANRDASMRKVQADGAAAFAEDMLPRVLAPTSLADPGIADEARRIMAGQSVGGIVGALGGLRDRSDSRPLLPEIGVPVLVVGGAEDTLTPPADMETMAAAMPDAQVVIIPRAGHLSPLEQPAAVSEALIHFLAQTSRSQT
jgi:pimeloyl-ACP methyl ester carboxylesterase